MPSPSPIHTPDTKPQITYLFVLAGLPGSEESYTLEDFKEKLAAYDGYTHQDLEQNLRYFLEAIMPFAEKAKINMALHPDDPPMDLFGLPRVVSNEADYTRIISEVDSPRNGITFCTGSLGVNPDNDLPGMVERLGHRIHFIPPPQYQTLREWQLPRNPSPRRRRGHV